MRAIVTFLPVFAFPRRTSCDRLPKLVRQGRLLLVCKFVQESDRRIHKRCRAATSPFPFALTHQPAQVPEQVPEMWTTDEQLQHGIRNAHIPIIDELIGA
jgi:hypothetical protein